MAKALALGGAAIGVPALANSLLARRARRFPAPRWAHLKRFEWRHGTIPYRSLGQGEPLVLIHSLGPGHGGCEWQRVAPALAADRLVLVPDLIGWGEADHPDLAYRSSLYVDLITDFLAEIAGGPAPVVAAGAAAAYALQVAADNPTAVRALGLVVPLGVNLQGEEPDLRDTVVHHLLRLPVLGGSALNLVTRRAALERYLRREVFFDPSVVTSELLDRHYRASHAVGAHRALAAYLAGRLNHRADELLSRVEQPVWIAWGREASSPALAAADLWLRGLPNAQLEVFAAAALLPHYEVPSPFAIALGRFLKRLPRGAQSASPAAES